jgi:thymidylate kinase
VLVVAVNGVAPGVGKSRLCTTLAAHLTGAGWHVALFPEEYVLQHPAFAEVAAQFTTTGIIDPDVLVEASVTYLAHTADAGADVVVLDSLIPYVPSLLAFGYDEDAIDLLVAGLTARIAGTAVLAVFLDGDPDRALRRAIAREPDGWLDWFITKLARYRLIGPEPGLDQVHAYLASQRDLTLRVLRRQPWALLVVADADRLPADHVTGLVGNQVTTTLAG